MAQLETGARKPQEGEDIVCMEGVMGRCSIPVEGQSERENVAGVHTLPRGRSREVSASHYRIPECFELDCDHPVILCVTVYLTSQNQLVFKSRIYFKSYLSLKLKSEFYNIL